MKAKTEELLYLLLWSCEMLLRPSWRNMTGSFESWAYRNGLHRQLARLENRQFVEHRKNLHHQRIYRLTESGRELALGGKLPETRWRRAWDGRWRMVLFDVPVKKGSLRNKLRRCLRNRGFGYLQNSVWITPDPLTNEHEILLGNSVDVESLILLEARPCAGESDAEIVAGAWDFDVINEQYQQHMKILGQRPRGSLDTEVAAKSFRRWTHLERQAWQDVVSLDPFLPEELLPLGYLGRIAWKQRVEVMAEAASQIRQSSVVK